MLSFPAFQSQTSKKLMTKITLSYFSIEISDFPLIMSGITITNAVYLSGINLL